MVKPSVFVTRRWPQVVEDRLRARFEVTFNRDDRPLSAADLRAVMCGHDAVLPAASDRIDARVLNGARPRVRFLGSHGSGAAQIDLECAARHGITVTNSPDVPSACVADLTMMLMLMVARRAAEGEHAARAGAWEGWTPSHMLGAKVSGKVLGIVGFGRIGQDVACRAHHGFGMKVLVVNRSPVPEAVLQRCGARQIDGLDDLLPQCDFVSLHCPGTPENRHLIDARRLNQMRADAFLINTSRGEVVNERALAHALWFETIAGAGVDMDAAGPGIDPDLLDSDRLVVLPDLGGATRESRAAMGLRVVRNVTEFFDGHEPVDRVV